MMDPRTLRAAVVADVATFATVSLLGVFLGFALVPSMVAGAVLGALAFLLLFAVARRAETFSPTDPTAHLRLEHDPTQPPPGFADQAPAATPEPSDEDDR